MNPPGRSPRIPDSTLSQMEFAKMKKLLFLLPALAAASAAAAVSEPAGISPQLRAPSSEQAAFVLAAEGVQIYNCKVKPDDAYAFQWVFIAPEATLKQGGTTVGHHGAGPTWVSDSDRTSVKGSVAQRQDGGAGNIPWLLLKATATDANGMFSGVTSIQRVNTKAGVEPSKPCGLSNTGEEARVPYTADYYFYKGQ
jgi:Protein of unknown function (DUF3455)